MKHFSRTQIGTIFLLEILPTFPPPPSKATEGLHSILHHIINIGMGKRGEGPIYFVSVCQN